MPCSICKGCGHNKTTCPTTASRPSQKAKKPPAPPPPLTRKEKDTSICTVNALCSLPTAKVQLWHFPVTVGNISNYEFEIGKHLTGETMLWSKPTKFDSYGLCQNICLITHEAFADVCIISQTDLVARAHWDTKHSEHGVISLTRIGKIYAPTLNVAGMCDYRDWNFAGKFQCIKKVTFREFIDNVKGYFN